MGDHPPTHAPQGGGGGVRRGVAPPLPRPLPRPEVAQVARAGVDPQDTGQVRTGILSHHSEITLYPTLFNPS